MAWMRGTLIAVLVATGIAVSTAAPATAASSASVSAVTCVEEQGSVDVSLTADADAPGDVAFLALLDGVSDGDPILVAPGATTVITFDGLDDNAHTLEVDALEKADDEEYTKILDTSFEVVCDPAPEGPYTHETADIHDYCGPEVDLFATNRPIGGNTTDLQPVTFVFTATQGDTTRDLATFTLPDSTDDPYTHTALADLSDFEDSEEPTVLTVTANGNEIAREEHVHGCTVVAVEDSTGGGGPAVVNTGA